LAEAWALYTGTGIPADPGWFAAGDQLGERATVDTDALSKVRDLDRARGLICLRGDVGSGRSYACARLLWRRARQVAAGRGKIAGVWIDAGTIGERSEFRSKGDARDQWDPLRRRALEAEILVLDDVGAAGSEGWQIKRIVALLEARYRGARGLTLLSTNVARPAFALAVGARLMDRMVWREVEGRSQRDPSTPPTIPQAILDASTRVDVARELDRCARARAEASPQGLALARAWLRPPGDTDAAWAARIAAELREADEQAEAVRVRLSLVVEGLRVEADGERAERERAEHARLRAQHAEKVERLRQGGA
jgi:hypothetical protein